MHSAQELISRRIFKPWFQLDFVWNLTDYPKILKNCRQFSGKIIDIIMSQKLTEGSAELSFVERLIRISEENENFSLDDVKAETIDALTAVRLYAMDTEDILSFCDKFEFFLSF